jgi:hypothetical protein
VAIPGTKPLTTPVIGLIDAYDGAELVQPPPHAVSVSVIDEPSQTADGPEIGEGAAITVTTVVAGFAQPVVYDIVVVPCTFAVTFPEADIVATEGFELTHVPPGDALPNTDVPASQMVVTPAIGLGKAQL